MKRQLFCAGLLVGINDGVISNSLKHLVRRPRPHQSIDAVRQVDLAKATPRIIAVIRMNTNVTGMVIIMIRA